MQSFHSSCLIEEEITNIGYIIFFKCNILNILHCQQKKDLIVKTHADRTARRFTEKLAELDTYNELLSKQVVQLQQYFDMCVSRYPQIDDTNDAIDAVQLADGKNYLVFYTSHGR